MRAVLLSGALALVTVGLLAPWLRSPWLYVLARPLCHQRPERCFWFAGLPMAFCARCLGIYAGAALALMLNLRASRRAFLAALSLVFLDLLSEAAGLRGAWAAGRFATGLLAGGSAAPLVLRELRMSVGCAAPQSAIRTPDGYPSGPQSAIGKARA